MACDIIIPAWNQPKATRSCIEGLVKNTRYPYNLILIDNGSTAETKKYLEGLAEKRPNKTTLIRNEKNLGFIRAVNQGLKASRAPHICILNNDTLPGPGWLTALINFAERHTDAGLLNPLCSGHEARNMSVEDYARMVSVSNRDGFMEMNQCQGFCMLIKREVLKRIGHLDEGFGMGGFDDTDLSMRAHIAGYRCVCVHSSYVYHKEHASFDKMGDRKKIQSGAEERYFRKWPRHLRIAMVFSVSKNTSDEKITNFLNSALFLARKWCWANLFIFGGKPAEDRVISVKRKIGFPLHQNIKMNFLNSIFRTLQVTGRILERSFGRKKRKRYDALIVEKDSQAGFLGKLPAPLGGLRVFPMDFGQYREEPLKDVIAPFRGTRKTDLKCDIILPVCDQYEFTKKCIESIMRNTDTPYRLIIINNGTNPATKRLLDGLERNKEIETTIVHNARNVGWVKALNKGIDLSKSPYVCFQNDDTVVTAGWLKKMINTLKTRADFGIINPTWEGRPPNVSIDKYNLTLERNKERFIETDWCRGFCAVIKRSVIEKIGKVDEIYGLAYFDDVDYSVRAIEAGFVALRALDTYVYHHRNVTFFEVLKGKKWNELHEKNKLIYYKKWGKPLKVVIILNDRAFLRKEILDRIEEAVFYLARKQHRIDIWSPGKAPGRFRHTNVKMKVSNWPLLKLRVSIDLGLNKTKKPDKRYNAVFKNADDPAFPEFVKETVDHMKEKTKDTVRVKV